MSTCDTKSKGKQSNVTDMGAARFGSMPKIHFSTFQDPFNFLNRKVNIATKLIETT